MNRPPTLTLPDKPRELWLATRDIVTESLDALAGRPVDYRIGGGTVLAARWRHRTSFDIDLTIDESFPLQALRNPHHQHLQQPHAGTGRRTEVLPGNEAVHRSLQRVRQQARPVGP